MQTQLLVKARAEALVDALYGFEARHPDEPPAFRKFAELLRMKAREIVADLDADLSDAKPTEEDPPVLRAAREATARTYLKSLNALAAITDETFSRRSSAELSSILQETIERELGLLPTRDNPGDHSRTSGDILVVVGPQAQPPCTISDARRTLRKHSPRAHLEAPNDSEPPLHLVYIPFGERSTIETHAIVVGHELAHLYFRLDDLAKGWLGAQGWINEGSFKDLRERAGHDASKATSLLARWLVEILCDLRAVDICGPAAYAAIVTAIEGGSDTSEANDRYPSLIFRAQLMWERLEIDRLPQDIRGTLRSPDDISNTTTGSNSRPPTSKDPLSGYEKYIRSGLLQLDNLLSESRGGRPKYRYADRTDQIDLIRDELLNGTPAELVVRHGPKGVLEVGESDVINAALLARDVDPDKRGRIDQLTEKSLNDLSFIRRWSEQVDEICRSSPNDCGKLPRIHGLRQRENAINQESRGNPIGAQLSRDALRWRLKTADAGQRLVVTPLVEGGVREAGIDLRLGNRFIVMQRSARSGFDPLTEIDAQSFQSMTSKPWGGTFVLHPQETVLASVIEYVALPADLFAHVITRSSYGRLGLITATAVGVNPWYRGCLTLELVNLGSMPIVLTPGVRVASLAFYLVSPPAEEPPDPKYSGPTEPEFSRILKDPETVVLRGMRRRYDELQLATQGVERSD